MSVLGLDIGTSTCKGVVLGENGDVKAQAQCSYAAMVRLGNGVAEIVPDCFAHGAMDVIATLAKETQSDPIRAIAVSSHGETLIPIGRDGTPRMNAMLSMDRRSKPQSDALIRELGQEEIYRITGAKMHPQFPIPKIMHIKSQMRETANETVHFDTANDYVYRILGCPGYMDLSIASRFGGFDIRKKTWSAKILDAAGIHESLLSEPVCAGTVLGEIPPGLAHSLGLTEKVLLVAGGHDQPCAALAIGGETGALPVSAGSYECAALSADIPYNNDLGFRYGLNSYCHVLPEKYVTLAFFVSGMMVQWYLDTFCAETVHRLHDGIYRHLESEFSPDPTGICFTPHIYGSMNPEWCECATAKISGLTANATKADLYKAVLEGTSCELDLNVRVLEKLCGKIERLVMSGGGTKSDVWMQLRADITGKNIDAVEYGAEASCLGAAILAGIGCGYFNSAQDAVERISGPVKHFTPRAGSLYEKQKNAYLSMHSPGLLD